MTIIVYLYKPQYVWKVQPKNGFISDRNKLSVSLSTFPSSTKTIFHIFFNFKLIYIFIEPAVVIYVINFIDKYGFIYGYTVVLVS